MLIVRFTLNIAYGQKSYHNRKYTAQRSQWRDYAHFFNVRTRRQNFILQAKMCHGLFQIQQENDMISSETLEDYADNIVLDGFRRENSKEKKLQGHVVDTEEESTLVQEQYPEKIKQNGLVKSSI